MPPSTRRLTSGLGLLAACLGSAFAAPPYEVWAIDQSNSPGKGYGGTLYVYDGGELERGHAAASAVPEKIDLAGAAAALCLAKTGFSPKKPPGKPIERPLIRSLGSAAAS